jgi:uncharacterized protein with beta-barrel porin domain
MNKRFALRAGLLATASIAAAAAVPASAQISGTGIASSLDGHPDVVIRDGFSPTQPAPGGSLDTGVNGVGQMVVDYGASGLGTCTGTLINPRTVLFAAHCVNGAAATAYGAGTGGVPISFGFGANNVPGLLHWLGINDPSLMHTTNTANYIYNVEQVWYDPRVFQNPAANGFLEADIALATLDTPAFNIPTWAMLFSPLTGETHATLTGYGSFGVGAAGSSNQGNWRRRAVENMVSFLGSLDDRNLALFGSAAGLPQNLYMLDFDDPLYGQAGASPFDFNIFGGSALPREGVTGPGDSGGPLIIDQNYDRAVVAGVLSGSSRFYGAQRPNSYGTMSIFQPLYLFWDAIVANNSYVYATNKTGDRDWTDASHWVQAMDPNYTIDRNGALVNDLPDTPALGVSADGARFGQVCFNTSCDAPVTGTAPTGDGNAIFVQGGPGSTNFVPNNVVANPSAGVRSRYYDVTLSAAGQTRVSSDITIDRLTLNGATKLNVASSGNLKVWGDFTQIAGWTNVDGKLTAGETLIVTGILSGSGVIDPTFLTVGKAMVAPGGNNLPGTLTVKGDVILSSASLLLIDLDRFGSDRLTVVGDGQNAGELLLNGGSLLFNKTDRSAPKHGQSFVIASATGGIDGTFGQVGSLMGVLKPVLTYGPNQITVDIRAGKFTDYIGTGTGIAGAFAGALDTLRAGSYNQLSSLYGTIDLMDVASVIGTFENLAPRIAGEASSTQEKQSRTMLNAVGDRLSMLGSTTTNGRLSIAGNPVAVGIAGVDSTSRSSLAGLMPGQSLKNLPNGMSGFIVGGATAGTTSYGGTSELQSQRSEHMAMGLEHQLRQNLTIGSAIGYAQSESNPLNDSMSSRTSQMALYASYRLGGGAYVGGIAAAEHSEAKLSRMASTGDTIFDLTGATKSQRYSVAAEAGVNRDIGRGLTLTPRARLGYSNYRLGGFREQGGEAALQLDDLQVERLETRLGAKLSGSASLGAGWAVVPQIQADYVKLLSGADNGMRVRFADASDYAFELPLADGASSWGEARGGLKFVKDKIEFGGGVETSVGSAGHRDSRAVADLTIRF